MDREGALGWRRLLGMGGRDGREGVCVRYVRTYVHTYGGVCRCLCSMYVRT